MGSGCKNNMVSERRKSVATKKNRRLVADTPGIALPKTSPLSSFCFYALLLFLAGLGAMGCLFSAFSLSPDRAPLLVSMAFCACLSACHVFFKKRRWIFWLLPPLLWGFLLWRQFDSVFTGCIYTVNTILRAYEKSLSLSLPVLASAPATVADLTAFAVFLQFPFFWLLALLWCQLQSALGAFALTGLFLLTPMAPSILPESWALGLLLLYWGFLLLFSPSLRRHYYFTNHQPSLSARFARVSSLVLLGLLALIMWAVYRLYPPEIYERPQFANDIRSEINEGVSTFPGQIKAQGFLGLGKAESVDLLKLGSRAFSGKTVLRTRHTWEGEVPGERKTPTARKEYLKSFSGSVYTGSSWERLSAEERKAMEAALGDYHGQTLLSEIAGTLPYSWADSPYSYTLSVESADGSGLSLYQPYGLSAFEPLPDRMDYQGDEALKITGLFSRFTEYELSARALPPEERWIGCDTRINGFLKLDTGSSSATIFVSPSDDGYDQLLNGFYYVRADKDSANPDTESLLSEEESLLSEALERYRNFAADTYTQVPEDLRPFLEEFLLENWINYPSPSPEGYLYCAKEIRSLLAEQCTYTLSPPVLPEGRDFAEYFLSESHRGYCVHFATAATLLLRTMGIPARYAEGYAVPVGENGQWSNAPDRNAHAWVELYFPGTGWVPFEVTPANPEAPAAYRNAAFPTGNEVVDPSPTPTPTPTPSPSPSPTPEASQSPAPTPTPAASQPPAPSGNVSQPEQEPPSLFGVELCAENIPVFLGMFSPVLVPLLLFLALLLYRRLRIFFRKLLFRRADRNKAALSVYAHLLRLYRVMALLPGEPTEPPEEITELALRARFSQHTLSQEELARLTELSAQLEQKLDKELSKMHRFLYKYLLCLF